ncbi:MAG TPA: hypothetical protein VG815_16015 [Chloroflexota bacterium]|nr:hypothetical protein [Chloroflexota bacterium]
MPLLQYSLTFQFARSVSWTNDGQVPEVLEICVIPLANPSFPDEGTYVGGLQAQLLALKNDEAAFVHTVHADWKTGLI